MVLLLFQPNLIIWKEYLLLSKIANQNVATEKNLLQKYVTGHSNTIAQILLKMCCAILERENLRRMSLNIVLVPNIWICAKWNLISNTLTIFGFPWQSYFAKIQKYSLPFLLAVLARFLDWWLSLSFEAIPHYEIATPRCKESTRLT